MSEADIARELADRTAPQPKVEASKPVEEHGERSPQPESGLDPQTPIDPLQRFVSKQTLMQHFGVVPSAYDRSNEEHIDSILDFVSKETGSVDPAVILEYINNQERQMGTQLSSNRLQKFRQFVVIRNQMRLLQEKERALANG